jgi:hypothetical protein
VQCELADVQGTYASAKKVFDTSAGCWLLVAACQELMAKKFGKKRGMDISSISSLGADY